jgi:hypothetical protein
MGDSGITYLSGRGGPEAKGRVRNTGSACSVSHRLAVPARRDDLLRGQLPGAQDRDQSYCAIAHHGDGLPQARVGCDDGEPRGPRPAPSATGGPVDWTVPA